MGSKKKTASGKAGAKGGQRAPRDGGSPGQGGDGKGASREQTTFGWWRENIEAFLVAVILAVIIRHFSVEAFEIPTGSMANTLFGMHSWLECPNCSTEYNVALQNDSSTGQVRIPYRRIVVYKGACPNPNCTNQLHSRSPRGGPLEFGGQIECGACGTPFHGDSARYVATEAYECDARCPICHHIVKRAVFEKSNRYGGHKILVTKFAYVIGEPRRWDVIVFGFDQWKNYIKRLVGLPGERIDVWDGDLYVNGEIERKYHDPTVQESLWTKISDSDTAERGLNPTPAWAEVATAESRRASDISKNAQWNAAARRWGLNASDDVVLLRYQRRFDNFYSYNMLLDYSGVRGYPDDVQVGDRKVAFTVRVLPSSPRPPGQSPRRARWVGAEIREGDFSFQLRIPVGSPSGENPATLTRLVTDSGPRPTVDRAAHPSGMRAEAPEAIPIGPPVEVEVENLDDRVAVRLGGRQILEIEYTSLPEGMTPRTRPPAPSEDPGAHSLDLIVSDVQAEVESIRVWRDLYYIPRGRQGIWNGIQLGEGEYFAMGDNAPSSSDGRYWGSIPEGNLMGKAFVVFWPAWPANFQCKFIR